MYCYSPCAYVDTDAVVVACPPALSLASTPPPPARPVLSCPSSVLAPDIAPCPDLRRSLENTYLHAPPLPSPISLLSLVRGPGRSY